MRVYKKALLPAGFRANAVSCGIKKSGKLDLALFYSDLPAIASCKFTANKIPAAPILINKRRLKKNKEYRAVIVNSGNANAFCGTRGLRDAQEMSRAAAGRLFIKTDSVLVASTGVIARRLPLIKIKKAVPGLVSGLSGRGIDKAKKAIMTTDKFAKEISAAFKLGNRRVSVCGVAKGAGMIAPDMATMLCFIFSDAKVTQRALDKALTVAVESSFNCITVDGCMSTNDSVIALANGAAANNPIDINKNFALFFRAVNMVCLELAKLIIKDAEGASKFIKITVSKAKTFQEARKVALSIANSDLFKAAIYGENPNFGRIVSAIGASGVDAKEKDLKINVGPLNRKEINVNVSISRGKSRAVVYTSDLTPEYVKINAGYN